MGKKVPLPTQLYRLVADLEKGGRIDLNVHNAPRNGGTCEIVTDGRKPIKCRAHRTLRKGRKGGSTKSVEVTLTRL